MRNSFIVQYSTNLWLTAMGVSGGPLGAFLAFVVSRLLTSMLDRGLIVIDIQIDKVQQALKDPQWREAASKAYAHASKKVYSEEEKDAIRKQYLDALARYATYGNGVSKH